MSTQVSAPEVQATKEVNNAIDLERATKQAVELERARVSEITQSCKDLGLSEDFSRELVSKGMDLDSARKLIIAEKAKADKSSHTSSVNAEVTRDEKETRHRGMMDALLHRSNSTVNKLTEVGRLYRGCSMLDMVRLCLEDNGVRTIGMTPDEMVKKSLQMHIRGGVHSTSDFPELLANLANKTLRQAYQMTPKSFGPIVREVTVTDFKQVSRVQLGDAPELELLPEGAEIKAGTMGESAEKYSLETYAKKVLVSRKAIVNDDLSAFTRLPESFGRRAAEKESDLVWTVILANAALSDAVALFHATHGNLDLGGAAAISVASIGAARTGMRKQKGLNGERITINPTWLIVPPELETVAQQFVSQNLLAEQAGNVNVFAGRLQVAVEPRLSDSTFHANYDVNAWYLTADTSQVDIVELARLQGDEGPVIESEDMFDTEGMKIKCRIDLAAKAIDYRGLTKNVGA